MTFVKEIVCFVSSMDDSATIYIHKNSDKTPSNIECGRREVLKHSNTNTKNKHNSMVTSSKTTRL